MTTIDAIKARCEAATPGPWRAIERGNSVMSHGVVTVAYDGLPQQNVCAGISPKTGNAAFIAHAREDIPYLLEQIESLTAQLSDEKVVSQSLRNAANWYKAQLAASQQETRAAVEDMTAMAYTIRQRSEHDDECCFACKYEIENVACDNYGGGEWECPGFDTDECFKWRGKDVGEQ